MKSNWAVGDSGSITSACFVPNTNLSTEIVRESIKTLYIFRVEVPPFASGNTRAYPFPLNAADSVVLGVSPPVVNRLNPPLPGWELARKG